MMYYQAVAESEHVSLDTPVKDLPDHAMKSFLYGTTKELFLHRIQENGKSTGYRAAFEGSFPIWNAVQGKALSGQRQRFPPICLLFRVRSAMESG